LGAGTSAAQAPDSAAAAQRLVRETIDRVVAAVSDQRAAISADPGRARALVNTLVMPLVDQRRIGRLVLGRYWRRASPSQQARFIMEFRTLVMHTYSTALTELTHRNVEYLSPRAAANHEVTIRTRIPQPGASPITINYRLAYRERRWKVFDVTVDGVSLVSVYRNSFGTIIKRDGLDGLIEQLVAKNRGSGST